MYYPATGAGVDQAERRREGERSTRNLRLNKAAILVPVDGSKAAEDAVRHVIRLSTNGMAMKVHLLNVQAEWAPTRSEYEKREGAALQVLAANNATRSARALLTGAGVDFESHLRIGEVADEIVKLAREMRCHDIVMGTRRLGTLAGFILGSVTSSVLRRAAVPVTSVRGT
jgi:nucleotide-binding universal stress UspA family protein